MLSVERLVEWGYPVELAEQIIEAELLEEKNYDETDDEERYYYDSL